MPPKTICLLFSALLVFAAVAQSRSVDSGAFLLHKFEQKIGRETYTLTRSKEGLSYQINFAFTDRGRPVPLQAAFYLNGKGEPEGFWIKGNTSRFSTVSDSVVMQSGKAVVRENGVANTVALKGPVFPIAGYAPGTVQMLLLQYWEARKRPRTLPTLPSGSLAIFKDGSDSFVFNGKPLTVNRYVVQGLIWGAEMLWTDDKGRLICLITNDAEGDKVEMMNEPHEALLPQFIERAAVYGMRLFTKATGKASFTKQPLMAIVGGNAVNLKDGSVLTNATLLLEDGKIKRIGAAGKVPVPENALVISAKGKTILPGLWDMHAHFEQAEWGPAYLAAGITTVRDCGGEFGYINTVKQAIDENKGVGPHILKAGFIDGKGPVAAGIIQADTKEEALKEVRRYKGAGFVQMKIYSSVKPGIVKVICDEAHRLGMTVTGHIPRGMTLKQGVDSGMDMVNHIQYVFRMMKVDTASYTINFDDSMSRAAFAYLKAHNVVIDPTLVVYELSGRSLTDSITGIEPAFNTLPPPLQTLLRNTGSSDSADVAFYKAFLRGNKEIVRRLVAQGTPVVAGTDMGMPGFSLYRELELYVEGGLTPLQALQSATVVPAAVMKMNDRTGTLEEGKAADIVIVDGNPLTNISAIRNVSLVVKAGRTYYPAAMHKLAGFIR